MYCVPLACGRNKRRHYVGVFRVMGVAPGAQRRCLLCCRYAVVLFEGIRLTQLQATTGLAWDFMSVALVF